MKFTTFGEMRRLPPLNALRAFEATARHSSVTAAAAELGVSHSAVSQQVKLLEDYFGQKLFDRPGRRVEPTPAAMALLEDVRAAFDRIALASTQLTRRGVRRVLTINAPPSFAMRWLIPRIAAFQRAHPNLELRVATSPADSAARLDGSDDLIVRPAEMFRAGFACKLLLQEKSTPVLHPQLRGAERLANPQQLANLVLLHTRCSPDAWRRWFSDHASPRSDTIDGPLFDDASFALQAALGGVGAALVPLVLAADDLAAGRLVAPFPERTVSGEGYYVLYREAAPHERGTRELLRWLDAEAAACADAPRQPRAQAAQEHALHAH